MMNKLGRMLDTRFTTGLSSVQTVISGSHLLRVERFASNISSESDQGNGFSSASEDMNEMSEDETTDVDQTTSISPASPGVYKAILMGEVGYAPSQKTMRNQSTVTMFSLGTSGMRNNRRPFEGEMPEQYRERSRVQWHRVAVYQYKLGASVMKFLKKGSKVYVEGNIETRIFFEPESKIVKRIQEIAVRQNGKIIILDQNSTEAAKSSR